MYRRHAILNARNNSQLNVVENNVYGIYTCSSIISLKIAMTTKLVTL